MCPRPRSTIPGASALASAIGARRLTSSIGRSAPGELGQHARSPAAPRWRRGRRRRRRLGRQPRRPPRGRQIAGDRRAAQLASRAASSTSVRRPVRISLAPRAANARAIAWPIPPVAPVTSTLRRQRRTFAAGTARSQSGPAPPAQPGNTRDRRGEPVQEAAPADRPDLAGREEARRRAPRRARPGQRRGVVVRHAEHRRRGRCRRTRSAPAGGAGRRASARSAQRAAQILVGRACVARVEAHDLSRRGRRRRPRRRPSHGRRRARRGRGSRPARTRACRRRSRSRSAGRPAISARSPARQLGDDAARSSRARVARRARGSRCPRRR